MIALQRLPIKRWISDRLLQLAVVRTEFRHERAAPRNGLIGPIWRRLLRPYLSKQRSRQFLHRCELLQRGEKSSLFGDGFADSRVQWTRCIASDGLIGHLHHQCVHLNYRHAKISSPGLPYFERQSTRNARYLAPGCTSPMINLRKLKYARTKNDRN
jgi:hypothetical protein